MQILLSTLIPPYLSFDDFIPINLLDTQEISFQYLCLVERYVFLCVLSA